MSFKPLTACVALALIGVLPVLGADVYDDGLPPPGGAAASAGVVASSTVSDASITTLFAQNNGYAGNMFDVEVSQTITIVGFDVNLDNPGSTADIEIYYRLGTVVGADTSSTGWTLLGAQSVTSQGPDNPTHVDLGGLTLNPGQTYGMYVTTTNHPTGRMVYTDGGPSNFDNGTVSLTTYYGKTNVLFGESIEFRQWNGTIYYNLGTVPTLPTVAWILGILAFIGLGAALLLRRSARVA